MLQSEETSDSRTLDASSSPQLGPSRRDMPPLALRVALLSGCFTLWLIGVAPRLAYGPGFSSDSAVYVDCARSISEGLGFMQRPYGGLGRDLWEPIRLWPPGYPLLIAGLMEVGMSPPTAAVAVATICSVACLVLLGSLYLARLPTVVAVPLLLATAVMPSFYYISGMAWSEAPCFALSLASLLCMMKWTEGTDNRWFWILAAGVAGGLAWCVRNAAVALFATSCLFLTAHLVWQHLRTVANALAFWLLGWGAGSSWLVYRNLVTFGKINPYSMPPSDLSLWDNLRRTWYVISKDMSGSWRIAAMTTNKYLVIGLLAAGVVVVALWLRKRTFGEIRSLLEKHRVGLLLVTYIAFVLATVVAARTVYRWGETISSRHYVPIYWAMWLLLSLFGLAICSKFFSKKSHAELAVAIMIVLSVCLQVRMYANTVQGWKANRSRSCRSECAQLLGHVIPRNRIVLTDNSVALRVRGNVNARRLNRPSIQDDPLTVTGIRRAGREGFLWGIVIWEPDKCDGGYYGEAVREILSHPERFPEFQRVDEWDDAIVLRWTQRDAAE